MSRQLASKRAWLSICSAHRFSATSRGSAPSSTSKESPSECAGSVDITSVRWPSEAARAAVAAATVVLPTPPLPVNSRIRTRAPGRGGTDPGSLPPVPPGPLSLRPPARARRQARARLPDEDEAGRARPDRVGELDRAAGVEAGARQVGQLLRVRDPVEGAAGAPRTLGSRGGA